MLRIIDGSDRFAPVHISRPRPNTDEVATRAAAIVADVRLRGDDAVVEHSGVPAARLPSSRLKVEERVLAGARSLVPPEVADAFEVLAERLQRTCEAQLPQTWMHEGVDESTGELIRPIWRVGVHVPGGQGAYASTVLMAAVPAKVAGVGGLVVASPPGERGEIDGAVLAACAFAGVEEVYRVGGAAAIAALAYGTETIRPVNKIVGPGDLEVAHAKRAVQGDVGVDCEAGPAELLIVADSTSDPRVLAADLIAQAEHGAHGTYALVTWERDLLDAVAKVLEVEMMGHEDPELVENSLIEGAVGVLVRDRPHALETANAFAPQHLVLAFQEAESSLGAVQSAGAVFVGASTPPSLGDYVGGTDHVLPVSGAAKWSSGLSVHDFVKRIYVSSLSDTAVDRLSPHGDALAEAERLYAHARAVWARRRP